MYVNTKISILIPVYNVEKYLSDCLNSVINQTMQDIEIICVNDGSTDHSLEILEEYASKDPRIKIISQENKGLLLARKVGVHHATGEYSLFLDSDDWLELNACEKLYNAIKQYDVEILQFQYIFENFQEEYKNVLFYNESFIKYRRVSGIEAFSYMLHHPYNLLMHGKLIKTSLLKEVYSSIEDIFMTRGEDTYVNYPLFYLAKSYYGIEEPYYHYRIGSGFCTTGDYITWERFIEAERSIANCYNCIKRFLDSHKYNESDSIIIEKSLLGRQSWATYWCNHNNNFSNSKAFDFVVDTWGIVTVLSQLARIYNTIEKQAKLAQSLQDSQILANEPIKNIHTIATYIPDLKGGSCERATALNMDYWLQLGYKVICFTNREPTENDYPYSQEVIRITLPQNLSERLETLQECIKKYNIDALIYPNHEESNLFWDLCLFKSCNVYFVVFNITMFLAPQNKINELQRKLAQTKKQLQPLQPFRTNIPAYTTLATALVGFHSHFPFLFRIFSFMIRRSYSVFFSLKNNGLRATIAKIGKFILKKLKKVLHLS